MKCIDNITGKINKAYKKVLLFTMCVFLLNGCGTKVYELEHAYDVYGTKIYTPEPLASVSEPADIPSYFAQELCVGEDINTDEISADNAPEQTAEAAGLFRLSNGDIPYSKNMYRKLYPASTTKILTAYIALKYGTLTDVVTVSAKAASQPDDSSICGIRSGDQLTLEELLYGLLLMSGNDAADAIAEYISGDTKSFAELMNQEAAALGASHSHFVNPHGLQDKKHYTCVYDLYLIFHAALDYDIFKTIIHSPKHKAVYKDAAGRKVKQKWETTDLYLTGEVKAPKGIDVIGGKTGTTSDAGYCLVLYSEAKMDEPVISIVLKADSRESLYQNMTELLKQFSK